jgi:hypothetical protein
LYRPPGIALSPEGAGVSAPIGGGLPWSTPQVIELFGAERDGVLSEFSGERVHLNEKMAPPKKARAQE